MKTKNKITARDLQRAVDQTQAVLSTAEFRERIRAMCGTPPRAARPCVRTPEDRGYYPPQKGGAR
jgi:hypothetical protein